MMDKHHRTYQTRTNIAKEQNDMLSSYAILYGKAERTLFARLQAGEDINNLKRDFQKRFGITARQFNAIHAELKGKILSIKERQSGLIDDIQRRIAKAKRVIKKTSDPYVLHQKKRRLVILQGKFGRLKMDRDNGILRLCFGSKKLFRAQFHLAENGYNSYNEWLTDWQSARSNQFFVVGSKDETAGCQGCVATVNKDGSITLRLRLPNSMSEKYTVIDDLRFEYGHEKIITAIGRNLSDNKEDWQALNYRFLKDDKGWRVFVTVTLPEVKTISDSRLGVIGMDINANHLAITETDRYGNPIDHFSIPCVTYGKTAVQRKAVIGDAIKLAIAFARNRCKPIVVEKLNFQKKKAVLEKQSPRYARMLSSLAYVQIQMIARARAFDAGIEVFEINPTYTSVIGQYKFKDRYGMSVHNAAALVIGRRFLGFSESLPCQLQVTLPVSVRNRGRHVWSKWAVVSRKASAALAAHRQSPLRRSSPSPVFDKARLETTPPVAGEIPVCESSIELFD
jgi:IS605 OrfB family transposase